MIHPTLDWRPNPDPRSAAWSIALLDCYVTVTISRRRVFWNKDVWLDQRREGACTGFGAAHVLASTPRKRPELVDADARRIYLEARRRDECPGEDYEGSSVNGAMKACREFGYIKAWRWVNTMDALRHALSYHGPVEAGTYWWSNMWAPDSNGFLHPSGEKVGGHAYKIGGYRTFNGARAYKIENSWGRDWGIDGFAWIWEAELEQLLADDGEFAIPEKVRV